MNLYYDGSLSGFLCLLGSAIKERLEISAIYRNCRQTTADLFAADRSIATEIDWAAKVTAGLQKKLGKHFMLLLAQALYSEADDIEYDLILLTRRALHLGAKLLRNPADPLVNRIESAARRTARERHRLLGLLRFRRLTDDSYFACCSPKTNVVPLLGSHFSKRLGDQRWLILDNQRRVGVLGANGHWQVIENVEISANPEEHDSEQQMADLWRCFYHSISNPDRFNPQLRQQFIPKYYWPHLTEMHPEQS